jgi:hypothetical protein
VEDLRIALRLEESVKMLPCVAHEKESVKKVLLELLYSILEEMDEADKGTKGEKAAAKEKKKA